jgi:replication factor C subunit 1
MSIHDKTGLFFQDYSFGPLYVQENYPCVVPQAAKGNAIKTLDLLGRTAHCMSQTDLIEKVIRSQNAWSLLPVEAVFASVVPGQLMEGFISSQIVFPSWLGKNSRTNKMDRLLQELQTHMRLKISGSKRAVNLDYLPYVLNSIVGPLKRSGADGVSEAIRAMESYDLMREDLDSLLEVAQWPHKPDIMAGIYIFPSTNEVTHKEVGPLLILHWTFSTKYVLNFFTKGSRERPLDRFFSIFFFY